MKIKQSELINMIRHSLNESTVNLTGRINNKKKFKGDNFNRTNDAYDDNHQSLDQIINNAVVLSNFKNEDTFLEVKAFVEGTGSLTGYQRFCLKLKGKINQIYNTPLNDDYVEGYTLNKGEDPLGSYTWTGPKNSPFEWDDRGGYVVPKMTMQLPDPETGEHVPVAQIFDKYFEKYSGVDGSEWEKAVVHEDKGEVIFFFENISDRKCFTKQIKNMFWICKREPDYNHGGVGYKYAFYAVGNPFEVTEYDNWNVDELVSDENNQNDMDIRNEILRRKKIQDDFLKANEPKPEAEPEVGGEEDGDDYARGFEDGVFHDANGFRVKGPVKPIRESKKKMKITESQLRKMVRDVLKEMYLK